MRVYDEMTHWRLVSGIFRSAPTDGRAKAKAGPVDI